MATRAEKQDKMFALVERFLSDSRTQPDFCRSVPIALSTFQFWLKRYRRAQSHLQLQPSKRNFLPVTIASPIPLAGSLDQEIIIKFPHGVSVQINGRADVRQIIDLVYGCPSHDVQ